MKIYLMALKGDSIDILNYNELSGCPRMLVSL